MADPVISGNDVFSHTCVGASDLAVSTKFYDATLGVLGIKNMGPFGDTCMLYGSLPFSCSSPAMAKRRPAMA